MDTIDHQYRSGEARADLFAALGGFIYGAMLLWASSDMREVAVAFMLFAGYWLWRAVRSWRRPYVQMSSERLIIFERGRPKHYIELTAIASIRQGWNRTVLLMRDGMKIPISHLGFMFSDDARHFRQTLAERCERAVG